MLIYVEINLCTMSWLLGFSLGCQKYVVEFFSASVGKANSAQLCMVPRLHIRWRSAWITCDFPRHWSASPASLQTTLICWLPSESPINTSVDRNYLLPSECKWVQGRLEYGTEDESSYRPTTPSHCVSAVVSEWRSLLKLLSDGVWTVAVSCGVSATEKS